MATVLVKKLKDGTEVDVTINDDKMAKTLVDTRDNFSYKKSGKSSAPPKTDNTLKKATEKEVIPTPDEKAKETATPNDAVKTEVKEAEANKPTIEGSKSAKPKVTFDDLIKLPRPRLVQLAKKFEVSAAGKNTVIAKRIFDKAVENTAKLKSDAE